MDEESNSQVLDFSQSAVNANDRPGESEQLSSKEFGISCPTQAKFSPVKERRFGLCQSCKKMKIEMKAEVARARRNERSERYKAEKEMNNEMEKLRDEVKMVKESRASVEKMVEFLQELYKKLELENKELRTNYHRLVSEKAQIMKIYNS